MSDYFFGLTPDRVLQAVERADLRPTGHCTPLMCLENRVYDVRLEDGVHVVVKFYRPGRWSREAILEEHGFLADLQAADIPVCVPRPLAGGETLLAIGDIHYAIWPRTGGRTRDELDDEAIAVLGRLLARIHNVGATRGAAARPELDADNRVLEPLRVLEDGFLPPSCIRRYAASAREIASLYAERSAAVPRHRIHGDCHVGNLLLSDAGWCFLDFDDFVTGPAAQDVWMLLPGRDREGQRQRAVLLDAYRQFREFDDRWLELVELLRGMRFVWYAAWIARRFQDPAFPDAFPHFGSESYWDRETRDLEEQLERVMGGDASAEEGPTGAVAEAPPELTNKDFFWDL
ncbi:MAG: serine/threonine protein kinase [Myxococcota bacterium]